MGRDEFHRLIDTPRILKAPLPLPEFHRGRAELRFIESGFSKQVEVLGDDASACTCDLLADAVRLHHRIDLARILQRLEALERQ